MIVKMKKVTLLCVESERTAALEQLRKLGIMHVDHETRVETERVHVSEQELESISKICNIISGIKTDRKDAQNLSGEEVFKLAQQLLSRQSALEKEQEEIGRDIEALLPWGDFSPESVDQLAAAGVQVLFCKACRKDFDALELPENTVKTGIAVVNKEVYFLLIFTEQPDTSLYPVLSLPRKKLSDLRARQDALRQEKQKIADQLAVTAAGAPALQEYFAEKSAQHEFMINHDGMGSDGAIAYLHGYIPADELANLTGAARRNGWALTADDPAPDDARVPTLLRKPQWVRLIDPLFDFIGIEPGYRENDVSAFFLIAFPVFFGILIGDSAYGALFIIAALLGKYLLRQKKAAQMPLNLLILLSVFSLIYGLLTGSCMGLRREILPGFLKGLDFLADPGSSPAAVELAKKFQVNPSDLTDKFTQWFCFLLAALHLSAAHLFQYVSDIRNWRSWGNIGWACVIWGNFFTAVNLIVFPGTFPKIFGFALYGVGILLIVVTITGEAALNLPFSLIGSFVDVLSYIRLFAVGLSGVYVASCFNDMGAMVLNSLPKEWFVVGLIGLILVALAGHVLNILLGFMGVLVHAVRLNTLEFSSHAGMQWAGFAYRPFAERNNKNNNQTENNHKEIKE